MWSDLQTTVGTLRVRATTDQPTALRLAVSGQLAGADLRPPTMPPAAVLIVRRLTDPLPGRLGTRPGMPRPNLAWEWAVQGRLADLYRGAARPWHGRLPTGASAVRFRDPAEMLACLAQDLATGRVGERWWWQQLRHRGALAADGGLARFFAEHNRHLPAILAQLAAAGRVGAVCDSLGAPEAAELLALVVEAHGLSPLLLPPELERGESAAAGRALRVEPEEPFSTRDAAEETRHPGEISRIEPSTATPPWRALFPATIERPRGPVVECLLGVSLALQHAPARARSTVFAREVRRWWRASNATVATVPIRPGSPKTALPRTADVGMPHPLSMEGADSEGGRPLPSVDNHVDEASPPSGAPGTRKPSTTGSRHPQAAEPATRRLTGEPRPGAEDHRTRPARAEVPEAPSAEDHETVDGGHSASVEEASAPAVNARDAGAREEAPHLAVPEPGHVEGFSPLVPETYGEGLPELGESPEEGIETRLGGVFYLLNLIRHLDLPACFEVDWGLASRVGSWGLLELLARSFLETTPEPCDDDPLWDALATLDGRASGELPGSTAAVDGLPEGEAYHLPEPWLAGEDTGGQDFLWAMGKGRLRLWSTQDYLVVEAPLTGPSALRQARSALHRYRSLSGQHGLTRGVMDQAPFADVSRLTARGLDPVLGRWLARALPFLRHRLAAALGFESAVEEHPVEHLLRLPARLYVTRTHVDLVTDLEQASVAMRRAGLDRDPGWVPELGRVVHFHFE